MPTYGTQTYVLKHVIPASFKSPSADGSVEEGIRAHLHDGNRAFFREKYQEALSHYLAAWGLLRAWSRSSSRRSWAG